MVEIPTKGMVSHTSTIYTYTHSPTHSEFTYSLNVLATGPGRSDTLPVFNWRNLPEDSTASLPGGTAIEEDNWGRGFITITAPRAAVLH